MAGVVNKANGRQNKRRQPYFDMYEKTGRRVKNKRLKLARHIKKYPNDEQAKACLEGL